MKFLEGTDIVVALALTQSETEMAREDYEKISFSQWNNIAEKTGWSYHPELRELSLKWMFNLIDNDLSTFEQCKQLMLREGLSEQLERLMFDKAKTFEDWLYIHIHFTDNQSYQNQSFEEMSRLEGEFASYVKLLEINFENRESRFFKLAEKKIFQVEHRINVTDWARGSNKFDQYFKLVALNKNIEYANSFSDWNNIFIHEIELEQRNSPQCVKCFEGMYATAGRSINYLDILYDLLIAIQKGCEFSIEKEYFEKNNS